MNKTYRLEISCPDQVGIVAKVSAFLTQYQASITEASHHTDVLDNWFFMRHEFKADAEAFTLSEVTQAFAPIAEEFDMQWKITESAHRQRVVLMCSKESHCLADLLHRWHSGELNCDIPCVISNHNDLRQIVEWYDIPFIHVPVDKENKAEHFAKVQAAIEEYQADTVVLARYMQIMPEAVCKAYAGRMINIHHSFLPSFAGARPYHQAYARGVKLIGATCHYVTADLDAGPIIEQEIVRISHSDTIEDMIRKGKDCEKMALAHGLRYHLEDRVLVHGNKTVVFS